MKVILIGAGSYVFAPTVLNDIIVRHRLSHSEMHLVDINRETPELMAGVGQRLTA